MVDLHNEKISRLCGIERRILQSDLTQMYLLLGRGQLDNIWAKLPKNGKPTEDAEVLNAKADLAVLILEKVRAKNKEESLVNLDSLGTKPITLGIEIEYPHALLERHKEDVIESGKINRLEAEKIFSSKKKNFRTISDPIMPIETIGSIENGFDRNGAPEMKTTVVASPRTILREMLVAIKAGGLKSQWNVHETYSVNLDKDNTQVMDITAIEAAAGLINPINPDSQRIIEKARKPSKTTEEGKEYHTYFSFHKSKNGLTAVFNGIEPYPEAMPEEVTEKRSLFRFSRKDYPRLVRQVTFSYLASYGIQAVQKEPQERTSLEVKLAENYNNMISNWNLLLQAAGIENPPNEKRYSSHSTTVTGYDRFINILLTTSHNKMPMQDGMTFRRHARQIITQYNKVARELIDY